MKSKEELNALGEEALEQVVGGNKIPDSSWTNHENEHGHDKPACLCLHYDYDNIREIAKCDLPITGRTLAQCEECPAKNNYILT